MYYRVTDSKSELTSRIALQQGRLSVLQERLTTGKRINRPSDDPSGTEVVMSIRTTQTEIEQFRRNADTAWHKLTTADDTLNIYENVIDRVRTLVSRGMSDTTEQEAKNALATELETVRNQVLSIANTKYGDEYVFGGTRQNIPPFDPTTAAPAATPTAPQYVQIEPGANAIATGATADTIFSDAASDIFTDLTNTISALRGTGDPVADRATLSATMSRANVYSDQAYAARIRVGSNMNFTEIAKERLSTDFASLDERAGSIEGDDFAATAVEFADAKTSLDAMLQVTSYKRRTLFDFLG